MFDPYSVLGVSRDASDEEIKKADVLLFGPQMRFLKKILNYILEHKNKKWLLRIIENIKCMTWFYFMI